MEPKQLLKQMAQYAVRKLVWKLLKMILPYVLPVLGIFIVCILAYYMIFEMPKEAISGGFTNDGEQVAALYYGSAEEQDESLYLTYQEVADGWKDRLNQNQLNQVESYALPWGWLAIVDRTLNDPSFLSTYLEPEKEVILKPEQMFKEVKPTFKWDNREKKTISESCVRKDEAWVIVSKTTVEQVELLLQANTMQNSYVYYYKPSVIVTKTSSPCGTLTTTVYWFSIINIETVFEDWYPLQQLLVKRDVSDKDQEFLMDYWLSYLVDEDFDGGFLPPDDWIPAEGELLWPAKGTVSSSFGTRIHPITGVTKMHNGIDIAAPEGTTVIAAKAGTVIYASAMGTAGNAIIIQHGDMETRYYHLSQIDVTAGQKVEAGEKIGEVGSTGSSTGPHLHFEVRVNGEPVDPLPYFGYTGDALLAYRALDITAIKNWLEDRNSALADEDILEMIDDAGKSENVDPHLLIAITGAEQSFVPRTNKYADQIIKNPWNVFGSWNEGRGSTLTTEQSARIAAQTIMKLSKNRPSGANPIKWLSDPDNPNGVYATGKNWWKNVNFYYEKLSKF
ncbi:M23 family metallopeptidase [Paenibacillus macerans]|uniref:M23 family metallopeptidase n=1 Tax=Paenibacillus macerans TaxID=44252 RepID=UPI0022E28453|nr:M23 family metallopeptidase [Paenibacillus macerans]